MSNTPSKAEIEALVKRHGATSYRNRADTQHPAYGFTEDGLNGLIDEVLAKWAAPQQEAQPNYVVSLVVVKEIPTGVNTQNKLYTVNAASADEAVGKAVLQMPSDFPEHRLHTACFVAAPAQPAPAPLSERDAFEAWIEKDGGDLGTFGTPPNMHYRNSSVNNAWVAWKARAAIAAQGGKV